MKHLLSLRDAHHKFAQYIHTAEKGNEVIITRRGKPITMITPLTDAVQLTRQQQKACKNLFSTMEKGFPLKGEVFNRDSLHER